MKIDAYVRRSVQSQIVNEGSAERQKALGLFACSLAAWVRRATASCKTSLLRRSTNISFSLDSLICRDDKLEKLEYEFNLRAFLRDSVSQ